MWAYWAYKICSIYLKIGEKAVIFKKRYNAK